jgi:hypothetical protein
MASSRDAKGSAAMVAKLAEMMDAGMHYEAQQMYQNAALRLGSHGQAAQARRLLRDGTGAMVAAGKVENAMALAKQYIEISADSPADDAAGAVEEVVRMCAGFPDGSETQQLAVLHAAIKWTAAAAGGRQGDARLHLAAARCHRTLNEHGAAAKHYPRGFAPAEYAAFLEERSREALPEEQDLFICRAVLQYLALGNTQDAHAVLAAFAQHFEPEGLRPTPLLNFTRLITCAVERENYVLYATLMSEYAAALSRDPSFRQYANHIGELWFGIKAPAAGGGLGSLLGSFMGT